MMEGGGVATNRHPPASPGSSIFPRRDIFREVDYPDHVFWASNGSAAWVRSKIPRSWRLRKPEETPFDIVEPIRCSLLENQNQSELFETITEQEAIFHGAT